MISYECMTVLMLGVGGTKIPLKKSVAVMPRRQQGDLDMESSDLAAEDAAILATPRHFESQRLHKWGLQQFSAYSLSSLFNAYTVLGDRLFGMLS